MESKSFNLIEQQNQLRAILSDKEDPSFFILNNTDRPVRGRGTKTPGTLLFTVLYEGQSRIVRVPVSWVPIDASVLAPKESIAKSAEFMRALSAGVIMVLTRDQALKIIQSDLDSQDEYQRAMAIAQGVNGDEDAFNNARNPNAAEEDDPWAKVSPDIRLQVEEVQNETVSEAEFRSYLRRMERSVSALDRAYILDKIPDVAARIGVKA